MLLKRLEICNVRKLRQVEIDFHGAGIQLIQGPNKSGKTTIAQSIAIAMEGTKAVTPGMITQGEAKAEIVAYTDDGLQIKTTIQDSVKQAVAKLDEGTGRYVTVSGGVRSFLDSIRSGLEMPWGMKDMTDARIIEILKNRTGITKKIDDIDANRKQKESLRTEVGRDIKALGKVEPPVDDKGDPLNNAKHPDPIDDIQAEREKASAFIKKEKEILEQAANYIKGKCVFSTMADIHSVHAVVDAAIKCAKDKFMGEKAYTQAELESLEKQLAEWVKAEQKAKAYDDYIVKKKKLDEFNTQYETLTQEIEALRDSRKKALSSMKLGVKGLEITEDNILVHNGAVRGITDSNQVGNWSTAESVQVFFSIAACFSGEMKVIVVDNCESLDRNTTAAISDWAEKSGFLVIMLKVAEIPDDMEDGIVYVREGEVVTK
jgi:hypothetical protein